MSWILVHPNPFAFVWASLSMWPGRAFMLVSGSFQAECYAGIKNDIMHPNSHGRDLEIAESGGFSAISLQGSSWRPGAGKVKP
jgi:hypothetical protein